MGKPSSGARERGWRVHCPAADLITGMTELRRPLESCLFHQHRYWLMSLAKVVQPKRCASNGIAPPAVDRALWVDYSELLAFLQKPELLLLAGCVTERTAIAVGVGTESDTFTRCFGDPLLRPLGPHDPEYVHERAPISIRRQQ